MLRVYLCVLRVSGFRTFYIQSRRHYVFGLLVRMCVRIRAYVRVCLSGDVLRPVSVVFIFL